MRLPSGPRVAAAVASTLLVGGSVAACGAQGSSGGSAGTAAAGALPVVTSFYPIQYAVQQVGGTHVDVTSLTKPGAEPHDLELTPQDVATVAKAKLVVYAQGFQPAVDTAVAQEAKDRAFDVAPAANLDLVAPPEEDGPQSGTDTHTADASDPNAAKDPHFWLDPERYAAVAKAIGQELATADPANAADYARNTTAFTGQLDSLDAEFKAALASCTIRELVTGHAAFGYLSQRYGFTQVPIAGLSPDAEPSAAKLAEVADFVKGHHVTTIYAETLVEPAFAETVARSTGATLATLDPIEGLTTQSKGSNYLEVMRSNLTTLRAGQACP